MPRLNLPTVTPTRAPGESSIEIQEADDEAKAEFEEFASSDDENNICPVELFGPKGVDSKDWYSYKIPTGSKSDDKSKPDFKRKFVSSKGLDWIMNHGNDLCPTSRVQIKVVMHHIYEPPSEQSKNESKK